MPDLHEASYLGRTVVPEPLRYASGFGDVVEILFVVAVIVLELVADLDADFVRKGEVDQSPAPVLAILAETIGHDGWEGVGLTFVVNVVPLDKVHQEAGFPILETGIRDVQVLADETQQQLHGDAAAANSRKAQCNPGVPGARLLRAGIP